VTLLRPIEPRDLAAVLELNHRNVELLASMDEQRLAQLMTWADRADVIQAQTDDAQTDDVAGFVFTFAPGTAYDSENYRWFSEHRGDGFYYLDRIVLADSHRRLGLGRRVYDELEQVAAAYGRMVLEVNVEPANEPSLAFHYARGYVDVAELGEPGKRVVLMEKIFA
jgi:predicted GNAT superfamily acetyltransferase